MDVCISNETKENLINEINNNKINNTKKYTFNQSGISDISSNSEGISGELQHVDDLLDIINTNHTNDTPIWKLYLLSTLLLAILLVPIIIGNFKETGFLLEEYTFKTSLLDLYVISIITSCFITFYSIVNRLNIIKLSLSCVLIIIFIILKGYYFKNFDLYNWTAIIYIFLTAGMCVSYLVAFINICITYERERALLQSIRSFSHYLKQQDKNSNSSNSSNSSNNSKSSIFCNDNNNNNLDENLLYEGDTEKVRKFKQLYYLSYILLI
jgi:hypothetical protein